MTRIKNRVLKGEVNMRYDVSFLIFQDEGVDADDHSGNWVEVFNWIADKCALAMKEGFLSEDIGIEVCRYENDGRTEETPLVFH